MKNLTFFLSLLFSNYLYSQAEHVIELDPATGSYTKVCFPIPSVTYVLPYCSTYDQVNGIYYFAAASPCKCLIGIDITSGQPVSSSAFSDQLMGFAYDNAGNTLYGFKQESIKNIKTFGSIDPVTTALTPLGIPIVGSSLFQGSYYTFDKSGSRYIYLDPTLKLTTISVSTGSVLSSPTMMLPPGQSVFGLVYNDMDKKLYACLRDNNTKNSFLVTIDLNTGNVWKVGSNTSVFVNNGNGSIDQTKGEYIVHSVESTLGNQLAVLDLDSGYVKKVSYIMISKQENVWGVEFDNIRKRLFAMHWSTSFELVGLKENENQDNTLYPLPASEQLTFNGGKILAENSIVRIRDVTGKVILERTFENGDAPVINRENITAGLYYFEINESGSATVTQKIVFD